MTADCYKNDNQLAVNKVFKFSHHNVDCSTPFHYCIPAYPLKFLSPACTEFGSDLITIFVLVRGVQLDQLSRPVEVLAYNVEAMLVMITASSMVYSAKGRMQCIIHSRNRTDQIRSQLKVQPWCIQLGIYQFTLLVLHVKSCFIAVNEIISNILIHEFKAKKQQEASILLGDNRSHTRKPNNKFRGINMSVDSMSSAMRRDSDVKPARASPVLQASIRQLFSCYASACGVVRAVDRAHGLALMLVLAVTFLRLVLKPYYFINDFFKGKCTDPLSCYMKFSQVYWILFHLVNLITVVEPCHLTHLEMLRTRELVCQLSRRVEPLQPLAVDLEQFCKHLLLNQVAYMPLNVITVSRHLILTILGNMTTYLVVIVEID